jgi:hypothetical protein
MRFVLALLPVTALAPLPAVAQTPLALQSSVFVERVETDVNGRERRVLSAPERLNSGDRLLFLVRYRNGGSAPLRDFAVTNAVPASIRIDPRDSAMQVSVDGGRSWGQLDRITMRTPLGGTRRATPDDVTHVRMTVKDAVAPGEGGRISYRGVVR